MQIFLKRINKSGKETISQIMKKLILFFSTALIFLPLVLKSQINPRNIELKWKTDTSRHLVPLSEFTALMQADGIPPIDAPKFWDKTKASQQYFEHEPVISVEINGKAKAYPLSVLMYHEIVNDELGGEPISATYCPLCNAAIVFNRRLEFDADKYLLDFGVSGMLRNSDLVMWDRQTESWWQQFTGDAQVGKLMGAQLTSIPSMLISLKEFFENYPEGLVLSTETGYSNEYGTNPYTGYDNLENAKPRLFNAEVDPRLPAMERVIDVNVNMKYKIYPMSIISEIRVINDIFEDEPVVLFYTSKTVSVLDEKKIEESKQIGSVTVFSPRLNGNILTFKYAEEGFTDEQSGSTWNITGKCTNGIYIGSELRPIIHGNHFAFSWFAFHQECKIYGEKN